MRSNKNLTFRILHRYLGFFLSGVMAVYAISGVIMIFRNTDFLKSEVVEEFHLPPQLSAEQLAPEIGMRIKEPRLENDLLVFRNGSYNTVTGEATTSKMELPYILEKMEHLHKATTKSPLYYFNIFFGLSLLFFVFSAFWMFAPKMPAFKKGIYFALGGLILTLIMLFV